MGLNTCLDLIGLHLVLLLALSTCSVSGVQNDTNASALTGHRKEEHNQPKVIFAYVAFAVGGTLMFVGFIYLIVWALTAKDGQESPEPKSKHGVFMDQEIAGRKTAPENVGGGEELKYDPDTYLPIITVSDVPGMDNAYVNGNEAGYRIEQESKSDGDMQHNKNLLQVGLGASRRHSAEDPIVKTKRHSVEYGKKRHSLQSQQSHTQKLALSDNVALIAADRRRSVESGGRRTPPRRGRRHSDISIVSASSRRSSLHDELSRRRVSNISISEVEQEAGPPGEDVQSRRSSTQSKQSSQSLSRYRPYDSPKYRRASLNVENLHQSESNTDSVRFKDADSHLVAKAKHRSSINSVEGKRDSLKPNSTSESVPSKRGSLTPDRSSKRGSQHEKEITDSQRNSRGITGESKHNSQSDTASEDSSGLPRKKSWLYDKFAFRKKKKGKSDTKSKAVDGQSTDDGYSTIEGNADDKDTPPLTKHKKEVDYKSAGLLAVPLIASAASARDNDSLQQSSHLDEDKGPGKFQFRSAGPTSSYLGVPRHSKSLDETASRVAEEDEDVAGSYDHDSKTGEVDQLTLRSTNHADPEDHAGQSEADYSVSRMSGHQKRDSLGTISTRTTSSDGEPRAMMYHVQDAAVNDESQRSIINEDASTRDIPELSRHTRKKSQSSSFSDRNSNISMSGDVPGIKEVSQDNSYSKQAIESQPSSSLETRKSKLSNSEDATANVSGEDDTYLQPTKLEKSTNRSNSNESEGGFSYETAPSDTDSQKYAKANANRHSFNSGDSYASESALQSNQASLQQSLSGSLNNRLSNSSVASSQDSASVNSNAEDMAAADVISVKSAVPLDNLSDTQESERDGRILSSDHSMDGSQVAETSPPFRPDSPIPLEEAASTQDNVTPNGLEAANTSMKEHASPPPAPTPPTFSVPPPPPLPSISFLRKPPSSNDLSTLKPVKREGGSPSSRESSSPMPFMEELTKRLQKYSHPKVSNGAAANNVANVPNNRDVNTTDVIIKETEPLLYDGPGEVMRDGNNSSLSNESEMSIPQAVESGDDTAPQSPELPDNPSASGVVESQQLPDSASGISGPMNKQVAFRETVSHIPSPASSFSISDSQLAMFDGKRSAFQSGAMNPSVGQINDLSKDLSSKENLSEDDKLKVTSHHQDEVSLASESNSSLRHQEESDLTQVTGVAPGVKNDTNVLKPEAGASGLPQQEEFEYPSDEIQEERF